MGRGADVGEMGSHWRCSLGAQSESSDQNGDEHEDEPDFRIAECTKTEVSA